MSMERFVLLGACITATAVVYGVHYYQDQDRKVSCLSLSGVVWRAMYGWSTQPYLSTCLRPQAGCCTFLVVCVLLSLLIYLVSHPFRVPSPGLSLLPRPVAAD